MACCIFQIVWILLIHLWLSSLITSNTDGNTTGCAPSVMVPRKTEWKTCVTYSLDINCTIVSDLHCWRNITAIWCRIEENNNCRPLNGYTKPDWKNITENKIMMFLQFKNISMHDAGLYRCEIKSPAPSVGHAINVFVTDNVSDCSSASDVVSQENNTIASDSLNPKVESSVWLQSYVYICSGVGLLILIVVVLSVIIVRCRGQKKSITTIHENQQSAATPVADPPPPIYPRKSSYKSQTLPAQINPSLSCTYDTPSVRVIAQRDRSAAGKRPVNRGSPRQCHELDAVPKAEEENPLIYATLNHSSVPQRPARVTHAQIEASEYAAIKVT